MADTPDAPKIEFPCDYMIKVVGFSAPDYKQFVLDTVRAHAPELDEGRVTLKNSRGDKFQSVTLWIEATGEPQLRAIFEDLKASGRVQMVL